MLDDKHETFRYMNGRKSIETALTRVPQHQQASFVYECMSYMSEHPKNPILRGDTGGGRGTPIG